MEFGDFAPQGNGMSNFFKFETKMCARPQRKILWNLDAQLYIYLNLI